MTAVASSILTALEKGTISGSWLVSGPRGVGKHAFVEDVVARLTGQKKAVNGGYHPNVKWLGCSLTEEAKKEIQKAILAGKAVEENEKTTARKKVISIDDIREGIQFLSLKPAENEYRILVIELAEDMNINAANALLKILEEPYPRSVLILISENSGKLLPTILSRCRKVVFPLASFDTVHQAFKAAHPECQDAELIAELANGSIGLAEEIYQESGLEIYQKINAFWVPTAQVNIDTLNQFADQLVKNEAQYRLFRLFLQHMLREKARQAAVNRHPIGSVYLDLFEEFETLFDKVERLNLDKKQSIINVVLKIAGTQK